MGASVSPISNIISGAEGLFNDSGSFSSLMSNVEQLGQGIGGVGQGIGRMTGNIPATAAPKVIGPTGTLAPSPVATGSVPNLGAITNPNPSANPVSTIPSTATGTIPSVPAPTAPITGQNLDKNLTQQVGSGLADTITNFLNSLGPNSQQAVQAIINANQPNVQQGSAQLNENLAASGISPSSSVSAIENANYMSGVQQQNLSELAQTFLGEQSMTEGLLSSLVPGQQQTHAESSPWNIISNVLGGIGGIFGL